MRALLFTCFLLPIALLAFETPRYDPSAVTSIKGKIASIQTFSYATKPTPYIQIIVRTLHGEIAVDLAPQWYIESQGIVLVQGEEIEIKGSMLYVNHMPFMIASSITIDGLTYFLRTPSNGYPLWH